MAEEGSATDVPRQRAWPPRRVMLLFMERLRVCVGDITEFAGDAIVNAANERLLGGGGVDGAIHRAAGPELLAACTALDEVRPGVRCPTGEARITPGFALRARFVIHTVGPVWRGGHAREGDLLASCYESSLTLARTHGARRLAFPAISCGVYGFPPARASGIAVATLRRSLEAHPAAWDEVALYAYDDAMATVLTHALAAVGRS